MKDYTLKGYSTWNDIMNISQITDIQDPVLEMEVDKYEFEDMYSDIVCELQGNDDVLESYIDYYFTVNPMKSYVLSFRSQKEKDEFYDIGLDKECVASLTEVCEGETEQEKKKRKKNEKDDYIVFE
jgi:hypothetical protein